MLRYGRYVFCMHKWQLTRDNFGEPVFMCIKCHKHDYPKELN